MIVGFTLEVVTLTVPVTMLYLAASAGVNVQPCAAVPAFGAVVNVVKVNVPTTEATPPLRVESAKV